MMALYLFYLREDNMIKISAFLLPLQVMFWIIIVPAVNASILMAEQVLKPTTIVL
jgi:hypothetical protein